MPDVNDDVEKLEFTNWKHLVRNRRRWKLLSVIFQGGKKMKALNGKTCKMSTVLLTETYIYSKKVILKRQGVGHCLFHLF